jgi:hypothetical protein
MHSADMSLGRYTGIVFAANVVAFGVFGYLLRDPAANPGWLWRLLVGAPLIAAFLPWYLGRYAKRVRPELRTSFLAYKSANALWLSLWGIVALALIVVLIRQ